MSRRKTKKLLIDRAQLIAAGEQAAAEGIRLFIEEAFNREFPDKMLNLNSVTMNFSGLETFNCILDDGYEVELT